MPQHFGGHSEISLLLINDGQNLKELGLAQILGSLYAVNAIVPILCIGIHAGHERKMEYGTAIRADYLGRGAKAGLYTLFIMRELLPVVYKRFERFHFKEKAFAGFSLGGLMALDIVWNYPHEFLQREFSRALYGGEALIINTMTMKMNFIASCINKSEKVSFMVI